MRFFFYFFRETETLSINLTKELCKSIEIKQKEVSKYGRPSMTFIFHEGHVIFLAFDLLSTNLIVRKIQFMNVWNIW